MKIERINENQIRCTLTSFDLSMRNLNLGELAYGSEKARSLFREMIKKAEAEVGFEAEDIPLMVEAIPLSAESIILVITKIEDPEELDTRFSRFSPVSEEGAPESSLPNELLDGAEQILNLLSPGGGNQETGRSPVSGKAVSSTDSSGTVPEGAGRTYADSLAQRIFCFDSLKTAAQACRIGGQAFEGESLLYKNRRSGKYYLFLRELTPGSEDFIRFCNLLVEYGTSVRAEYASRAYFDEHYERIIREDAVAVLNRL